MAICTWAERFFGFHFENRRVWTRCKLVGLSVLTQSVKGDGPSWAAGKAQWFILDVTPQDVPAFFKDDFVFGVGFDICKASWIVCWTHRLYTCYTATPTGERDRLKLQVCAGTDNKSTPAITSRGLSNKWPVQGIHMQLATTMRRANKLCKLDWRPREENQNADDLTNHCTRNFTAELQVHLTMKDIPMDLFEELHASYGDFQAAKDRIGFEKPRHTARKEGGLCPSDCEVMQTCFQSLLYSLTSLTPAFDLKSLATLEPLPSWFKQRDKPFGFPKRIVSWFEPGRVGRGKS